jgi:sorbitol/mannitol transport system substrate-binding protein
MYNSTAAMSIMFSGRMNDLTLDTNSKLADDFAFAAPPKVSDEADYLYDRLSIDGWSIPFNTELDHDMLFVMMASAVSEEASKASVPAAYPAREGMVTAENSPYGEAANASIAGAMPPVVSPLLADISNAILPILAEVITGKISVEDGMAQMQAAGEAVAG